MGTNVHLTPELERFAQVCVETGRFNNVSEVVRSALRMLQDAVAGGGAIPEAMTPGRFPPRARRELREAAEWIAEDNPSAALRLPGANGPAAAGFAVATASHGVDAFPGPLADNQLPA